ncbi:Predicted N-acyltransferase, GNAT family [Halolactibacillus miurensis]|uniref:Predicted N-acyltransferase, GNAT family n=1 Tax=Halolactibacillus miurensis TaxID=306541 RepID=A0A1I6P5Y4_9BACI|nr:Predicted N-acyltransferase, GNAT family [Halolactibacillus miurensis]
MTRITTQSALQHAFNIRRHVFIEEQQVPAAIEFDQYDRLDADCLHVLIRHDTVPAATGRVRFIGQSAKLERICVLKPYRKYGLGKQVIAALEKMAHEKKPKQYLLHGQTHAIPFYERLGYNVVSEVFMEDGIPHVEMVKKILND